jgi:hypothetical protein
MTPLARHIRPLAEILGDTPARVYERMRELTREGLLDPVPGAARGPAGVQATPRTIATMVIGMLASVSLTGAGPRARAVVEGIPGPPVPGEVWPFVSEDGERFIDALVRILTDEALAALVYEIEVDTAHRSAVIKFPNPLPMVFTTEGDRIEPPPLLGIRTRKSINYDTIAALAEMVREIMTAS